MSEVENERNEIELLVPDGMDMDDPIDEALAMAVNQETLVWDELRYLIIAPGEGMRPAILIFDEHAEELSLPQIYLGEPRRIDPEVRATPFDHTTSEARCRDRGGVVPSHVLYMTTKVMRLRISHGLSVTFRNVAIAGDVTRRMLDDKTFLEECVERDLAFLRNIPNSIYYWAQRKRHVFAIIRQLGKPTVFLTLSASELHWPRLLTLLERLKRDEPLLDVDVDSMHPLYHAELVNNDPIACALNSTSSFASS